MVRSGEKKTGIRPGPQTQGTEEEDGREATRMPRSYWQVVIWTDKSKTKRGGRDERLTRALVSYNEQTAQLWKGSQPGLQTFLELIVKGLLREEEAATCELA